MEIKATKEKSFYNDIWSDDNWDLMIDDSPAPKHRRRIISKIVNNLKCEKSTFLDIGCGNGSLIKLLYNNYPNSKFTGYDISEAVILRNSQNYNFAIWNTFDLDENDLDNKADIVICSEVIEHVRDWKLSLNKLISASNKYVIISVPSGKIYPIDNKVGHYQHFDTRMIDNYLSSLANVSWKVKYWGFPFHMLYKFLININANRTYDNFAKKKKYSNFELFISKVVNILFYFNFFSFFKTSQMFIVIKKNND